MTRADSIVYDDHKTVVHWEEVFDDGIQVPPHTVFQVWKSHAVLGSIVKAGHRAILSNSNAWYLNCGMCMVDCAVVVVAAVIAKADPADYRSLRLPARVRVHFLAERVHE